MQCDRCGEEQVTKAGCDRGGGLQYRCCPCRHRFTARSTSAFCGFRVPDDLIAVTVRWYLRLRLPYADVEVLLTERSVDVDRTCPDRLLHPRNLGRLQGCVAIQAIPGAIGRRERFWYRATHHVEREQSQA